ncbi:hypothetical protein FF011L_03340 [Roseimaritima multifibrata]|uniref:Uncharacterized protein n=1 Tax=Roseimaritima multifibrata TaxID=1930274 RepID=A0A517M9R4_9BACT|nr:hypothetical protein [Roseimaritima multifibrata]QDS91604.1 hypothetical protein FF011L_03340 [Roseimaritima multifibrata]
MTKPTGEYHQDASDRLCFEMFDVDAIDYPKLVARIVAQFNLKSTSEMVVGPDQLIGGYSVGQWSIGMDWDNWSGFFVTAHTPEAEPLVKSIGVFLSDG